MSQINPVHYNNSPSVLKFSDVEKMDDNSIWTQFDTDNSGTITDDEIKALGFVKEAFNEVRRYLLVRFGADKITNLKEGENYFDYWNDESPLIIASSIEDIPQGSHSGIRDARNCDISNLQLSEDELLNLTIDKTTVLSSKQKAIVDVYTEKMKSPGLGIRNLHAQGITGKGVKMAIIDQPLGKHQEYDSNIASHEKINCDGMRAQMHGAGVTSIAVGKTVGVAPDAEVDYYSVWNMTKDKDFKKAYIENIKEKIRSSETPEDKAFFKQRLKQVKSSKFVITNKPYVDAINKTLDKNETLPEKERVSVISISWGFEGFAPDYEEVEKAVQRAKEQGVFIVSTALDKHYGMDTCGANRNPKGDIEKAESYEAGAFFKEISETEDYQQRFGSNSLLVPMDHRTVADYTDSVSYRYEGNDGGMSWSTPWLAGMYVLAKQTDSDITPEKFWKLATDTSDECRNNDTGTLVGRIINPEKLIESIKQNIDKD